MLVAYNAPMFVFLGFLPVAILLGNGVGSPVTFLVCGAVVAMLAKGFMTMGLTMQQPGGFYSISAGLGGGEVRLLGNRNLGRALLLELEGRVTV